MIVHDTPEPSATTTLFGSDAIAATLRALEVPYVALNPGASFRGLHDSLVNYLGNERPQMLLCLHEDAVVAIAHGYAKAAERPMGAILHANVGLLHGSMGIFNAWCDRVPMLILGATGPWDATLRRPWIDWIHTVSDSGALVRPFTKWDNQPGSIPAAVEALLRAAQLANTAPRGPVYVVLDSTLQEAPIEAMPSLPDVRRYAAPPAVVPAADQIDRAADLLARADRPVILMGRVSRSEAAWADRVALAERLQAPVITNLKLGAAFPTDHPLHPTAPASFLTADSAALLRSADAILSLDWLDLAGTLSQAFGPDAVPAVIHVSPDAHSHRGFGAEYQALPPADVYLLCEADAAVPPLLARLPQRPSQPTQRRSATPAAAGLNNAAIAEAFSAATDGLDVTLARLSLSWPGNARPFRHPLDFLGGDGGGGIGSGPGMTVGTALALRDSGRLVASVLGDGDFIMGHTALWTAAHYRIPLLILVSNNRSYLNDEHHQERVALARSRPVANKWIGQRIETPEIDLAALARAQGGEGIGPIATISDLAPAIQDAVERVRAGAVCVVDIRVGR